MYILECLLGVLIVGFIIIICLITNSLSNNVRHCGNIVSVGGCNKDGYCGVGFIDRGVKYTTISKYPVVGDYICK